VEQKIRIEKDHVTWQHSVVLLILKFITLHINIVEMTAIELKKLLINRISEIDDISFLNALKTILDSRNQGQVLSLTSEQYLEISESKKEIEKGLYIVQEELDEKINKWAQEK